jgi:hypothetical protein
MLKNSRGWGKAISSYFIGFCKAVLKSMLQVGKRTFLFNKNNTRAK